jgi:hypothetical protein
MMGRVARILLAGLLLCAGPGEGQVPPGPARYVPAGIWHDPEYDDFYERWFGRQLRAMREPILSRPGDRGHFRQRFRLLVLPSFDPAYAIRLDETASGGRLRYVKLSGRGGYAPGRIATQRWISLDSEDARVISGVIDRLGLERLTPGSGPRPSQIDPETGEELFTACFDGTRFVFELVNERGSWFSTRHECDMPEALWTPLREFVGLLDERGIR